MPEPQSRALLDYLPTALLQRLDGWGRRWPILAVAGNALALVALFLLLDHWVMAVSDLPAGSYQRPGLLSQLPAQMVATLPRAVITALMLLTMLLGWRSLLRGWGELELGLALRPWVLLLAAMLAWWFASYPYNFYFDQLHLADRLALLMLALLIAWRPVFILPFVLLLSTIIWQFFQPIGDWSWAQPSMPMRLLLLLFAALWLHALTARQHSRDWMFVGLCLIAAHYWMPGLNKLSMAWPGYGHIYNFLLNTYANGWLGFLQPTQVAAAAKVIALFDWPMRIGTLVAQIGVLLLLWRRFTVVGFLVLWSLFHLGIFLLSGILFWQWMLLESSLALLIQRIWQRRPIPFVTTPHLLVSMVLIVGSPLWVKPVALAWLDAPISYTYRYFAVTGDGRRYNLPPAFFAPYDFQFTLGFFKYLSPPPHLDITWGASGQRHVADALMADPSPAGVARVERELGRDPRDPRRQAVLEQFIARFVAKRVAAGPAQGGYAWWSAPVQIRTWPHGEAYAWQAPITRVEVEQVTNLFDGERYSEIATIPLLVVAIAPMGSGHEACCGG